MTSYRMTLTMLSPVHIGTGETIDPLEYVIRTKGAGDDANKILYALDMPRFLARLSPTKRKDLENATSARDLRPLRRFINENADVSLDARWSSPCSPDLADLFDQCLNNDRAQLIVHLMTRDAVTGQPYLPGSSIKGALRTAWLSRKAAAYQGPKVLEKIDKRDFEPEVLGYLQRSNRGSPSEIRADPFRSLSVGDAPLCDHSNALESVVLYTPNPRRTESDPSKIQMYYDMTFSAMDGEEITAEGRMVAKEKVANTLAKVRHGWDFSNCVDDGVPINELLEACNEFYRPRLTDELHRFGKKLGQCRDQLLSAAESLKSNEALLRLGRFSHIECVTVSRRGGEPARRGTSRSLAYGQRPMGWVRLRLDPFC